MALIRYAPVSPAANLLRWRNLFLAFSLAVVIGSGALLGVRGLNLGVDFRGGILIEVQTRQPADLGDLRARLGGLGLGGVSIQEFGNPTDVLINVQRQEGEEQEQIAAIELIKQELGDTVLEYRRTEFVGPKVGDELRRAGILATVLAMLGITIYIWFRFEWQFAVAGLLALVHDVISTIGLLALLQLEFNLATLAAILTVAGYSINDTVVIFDRVREMLRKYKKMPLVELLDLSINSTLSRTTLTSATTLMALIALSVFGGEVIRGFSVALIWGVVIGTFSSWGLAVPVLSYMNLRGGVGGADDESAIGNNAERLTEKA
jgi:preprotein translocase subunit SecF